MSFTITRTFHLYSNQPKISNEPKYYLPLPKLVMEHLEQKHRGFLSLKEMTQVALGLDYYNPSNKMDLVDRIHNLDVAIAFPTITVIVRYLWKILLTQSEKNAQFRQEMGNRSLCVCNDDHLLFPEASVIRRYVNTHHAKDMTRSQRQSLVNTLENTRTCSSKLFDQLEAMRPHIADRLHKSILSLAVLDAPRVDLVRLELDEIAALEVCDGISVSDVSEDSQSEVSEVFYEENSDSSDMSLENENHSYEHFDDLMQDPRKNARVHRNFELQRAAKLHSSS